MYEWCFIIFVVISNNRNMPNKRNPVNENCTGHNIVLCEEAKEIVLQKKAEIEKIHQSSITEAINEIILEHRKT